jgi:uncharacterized protein YdcH (DUF465 family)
MANKKEPTLSDVLGGMNKRFNMVLAELQKNDTRFDLVFRQLGSVRQEIKEIRETQKADGEVLDEMRETLDAVAKAVDADAITVINHENRIKRLEKIIK